MPGFSEFQADAINGIHSGDGARGGRPLPLHADGPALADFIDALFRYADEGTFASLRAFYDDREGVFGIRPVRLDGTTGPLTKAARIFATECANAPAAVCFAPPVATFANDTRADEASLANGLALSVECDQVPAAARARLEALLGPATVIVASGGEWPNPETGELEPRLHLHWRLSEPTRDPAGHGLLKQARSLAAALVGGDPSNKPAVHPIRWAGSWHRKRTPRLARIESLTDCELELGDALERLQDAVEAAGIREQGIAGPRVSGEPQASLGDVAAAFRAIPNGPGVHWEEWNRFGLAAWRATGGAPEGLEAWSAWSAKSPKHDTESCLERWQHFRISPPTRIGAGTIFYLARLAGWEGRRRREEPPPHGTVPPWHDDVPEAEEKPRVRPEEKPPEPNRFGRLRILSVEDALDTPPREYLLDGLIAPGELSVWWGPPKCGKSFLLLRIAYGMSQGLGLWGREAAAVPVCYVAAEGGHGVKGRIHALRKRLGPAPNFHFIAQAVDLFAPDADLDDLIDAITAFGSRFVVLDTLARVMGPGDENQTRDMNAFVRNCLRIQEETGAHVGLIHHGGWEGSHSRGSIALPGAADIVVKVSGAKGEPKTAFVELAKDDESDYALGFNLTEEELPPDAKGRPRKTYVAEETEAPAATVAAAKGMPRLNEEAVSLFRHMTDAIAAGLGENDQPEPGMPLVPTLSRKVLHPFLVRNGWLLLPTPKNHEGSVMDYENSPKTPRSKSHEGSVTDAEYKRLYQRLTSLKNKGLIGFNNRDVWLAKAAQTL